MCASSRNRQRVALLTFQISVTINDPWYGTKTLCIWRPDARPGLAEVPRLASCRIWLLRYCSLFRRRKLRPRYGSRTLPAKEIRPILLHGCKSYYAELAMEVPDATNGRIGLEWLCSHSRSALAEYSSEAYVVLQRVSHSTPEVSEWRCHRHEYSADL